MRDPKTERLLTDVRLAVTAARAGGVSAQACLFDAAVAAVDKEPVGWPSAEARSVAVAACRALEPPDALAAPAPSEPRARLRSVARRLRRMV